MPCLPAVLTTRNWYRAIFLVITSSALLPGVNQCQDPVLNRANAFAHWTRTSSWPWWIGPDRAHCLRYVPYMISRSVLRTAGEWDCFWDPALAGCHADTPVDIVGFCSGYNNGKLQRCLFMKMMQPIAYSVAATSQRGLTITTCCTIMQKTSTPGTKSRE